MDGILNREPVGRGQGMGLEWLGLDPATMACKLPKLWLNRVTDRLGTRQARRATGELGTVAAFAISLSRYYTCMIR